MLSKILPRLRLRCRSRGRGATEAPLRRYSALLHHATQYRSCTAVCHANHSVQMAGPLLMAAPLSVASALLKDYDQDTSWPCIHDIGAICSDSSGERKMMRRKAVRPASIGSTARWLRGIASLGEPQCFFYKQIASSVHDIPRSYVVFWSLRYPCTLKTDPCLDFTTCISTT